MPGKRPPQKTAKKRKSFKGKSEISGRAWRFGDNISTDDIISGVHLSRIEINEIAPYAFASTRPEFAKQVKHDDLVVGGINFGIGSSREEAPVVIRTLGVGAVVAASFARIFFRNSFNIGLPALEVPVLASKPELIKDGDSLSLQLAKGILINHRTDQTLQTTKIPQFLLKYLHAGGALPLLKQQIKGH